MRWATGVPEAPEGMLFACVGFLGGGGAARGDWRPSSMNVFGAMVLVEGVGGVGAEIAPILSQTEVSPRLFSW